MKTVTVMTASALLLAGCSVPHGTKHYDAYAAEMQGDGHGYKPYDQGKADALGDDMCESIADKPPSERRRLEASKYDAIIKRNHTSEELGQITYIISGYCTDAQVNEYADHASDLLKGK